MFKFHHSSPDDLLTIVCFCYMHFYKARSQTQQQLETELAHQLQPSIIFHSITVITLRASLTTAFLPLRRVPPEECWVMREGKWHPRVQLQDLMRRKEKCVMWGCATFCIFTCELFISALSKVKLERPSCFWLEVRAQRQKEFTTGKGLLLTSWVIRINLWTGFNLSSFVSQTLSIASVPLTTVYGSKALVRVFVSTVGTVAELAMQLLWHHSNMIPCCSQVIVV